MKTCALHQMTPNPAFEATCAKSRAGASTPRWASYFIAMFPIHPCQLRRSASRSAQGGSVASGVVASVARCRSRSWSAPALFKPEKVCGWGALESARSLGHAGPRARRASVRVGAAMNKSAALESAETYRSQRQAQSAFPGGLVCTMARSVVPFLRGPTLRSTRTCAKSRAGRLPSRWAAT